MENRQFLDLRLIVGLLIAHGLMFFTFQDRAIFWYIFTGSLLILITYAMFQEAVDDELSFIKYISIGALSGLLLYFLFWVGVQAFDLLNLPFDKSINKLYRWFAPQLFWQYLALILVAAPGEELLEGLYSKKIVKVLWGLWQYPNRLSVICIGPYIFGNLYLNVGCIYFWTDLGCPLHMEKACL